MAARNKQKHLGFTFAMKALTFLSSARILEMFQLLKIIRRDLFLNRQLCRGHYLGVTQGENSEIQNAVFSK